MRRAFYITAGLLPESADGWLQRKAKRYVVCPFYHAVSNTPLPHITPIYRHRTLDEFRADLDWLQAHYEPVRWTDIDRCEQEQRPAFCLTFDDGLREFYTVVAPILEERHIPCVCFLNSAFVDNRDLMFRYREALTRQGIDWQGYLHDEQPYMTYRQIAELQEHGFEFGSHSASHPRYDGLSLSGQLSETLTCTEALREHIRLPHRLFSFPFGQSEISKTAVMAHAGTHEAVFGTENLRPGGRNLYNRIAMDGTDMPAKNIIRGEYLREIAHQMLHD